MANARIKYHANEHSILFGETGGSCPLCALPMMFKKASSKHPSIGYEIAHIYPLNPNSSQAKALGKQTVPDDINSLENVILLCPTCHTKFDKDFKIEEYFKLLDIKNGYLSEAKARLTDETSWRIWNECFICWIVNLFPTTVAMSLYV
ncbi:HNH endonuclease [Yersinia kristensenii]|uniref:HNH endonuclease signature motif containing protein n=1 Tax=Yersinia kristensenii TaxID=28152 RepID=UPI001C609FA3|nr:HNH endonuclease signature motif containing protein [Yersinia kristensenii]MBW5827531.1 HNH endonuclease [Yersinia kristensenii]